MLVLCAVITIWTFTTTPVNGILNITQSGSNKEGSTSYTLACHITTFNMLATLERNTISIGQCTTSGCSASTDPLRYTSTHDAGAIYVSFVDLKADEDGIVWTCKHGLDTSVFFTVIVDTSPTVTTEMPFKSSSLDQTASSQNPSTDLSKTQKTNTNRISTTDNVLTSMFPHFTSDHEVTTKISNRSNNAMEFSVGAVIAIVFSGIISVCLVVLFVCLYLRRKHTRKQTSETSQPKLRRTNEKQNKGQYSRKNVRGQTIDPSTYPTDYYDSGNPRTKNFNEMSNHRQKHSNENLNYELSQSMQNNIEDKITINYRSSRTHQTRAKNRGPPIPLAHFAPNNSKNYRCVSNMLYVDPHEPHAYMCQDYFVYPAYNRIQDRQSGQHCYY